MFAFFIIIQNITVTVFSGNVMSLNSYLLNMMFPFSVCGCGLASPCARVKAALPRRRCSCPVSERIRLGLHWFHLLLDSC